MRCLTRRSHENTTEFICPSAVRLRLLILEQPTACPPGRDRTRRRAGTGSAGRPGVDCLRWPDFRRRRLCCCALDLMRYPFVTRPELTFDTSVLRGETMKTHISPVALRLVAFPYSYVFNPHHVCLPLTV